MNEERSGKCLRRVEHIREHLSSPSFFSCYSIFSFMCMFCRLLFVLLSIFHLASVLSVLLRYTRILIAPLYLQCLLRLKKYKKFYVFYPHSAAYHSRKDGSCHTSGRYPCSSVWTRYKSLLIQISLCFSLWNM
jgi:hypothetical protein